MGIPHQQSPSTFKRSHEKFLYYELQLLDQQVSNRREELYLLNDPAEDVAWVVAIVVVAGMPITTVKIDGSWSLEQSWFQLQFWLSCCTVGSDWESLGLRFQEQVL